MQTNAQPTPPPLFFSGQSSKKSCFQKVLSHLAQNDLTEVFQPVYRKHHSTETAILGVCNDLLKGADDRKVKHLVRSIGCF